jgi:succinate dehydrogenase hydrophobic anchor subunit
MIKMANDKLMPNWRNFAAWSAAGAGFYILAVWGATTLLHQDAMTAILRPSKVTAQLALGLIFFMAVTGFSNRERRIGPGTLRNFLIQSAVAIIAFLLVIWGFSVFARVSAVGVSEWFAAVTGATLIVIASLGMLATASVHAGADLVDDEMAAEDMRERGRLILCSLAWVAACGLLLIVLSLSGPGVLSPATALASALVLIVILTVLGIAAWRLSDELGRTLSHETGNLAFYLIWVGGGGWAMLAHLGFVAAPAPLDWVTLFTMLLFAASLIVLGRRKLLRG